MKALSIRQPWAYLICKGLKDVENRSWSTEFRGRIYIHTGLKFDKYGFDKITGQFSPVDIKTKMILLATFIKGAFTLGAIIGEVDIVNCRYRFPEENDNLYSVWHEPGRYGFILANPVFYEHPLPCKGRLRFFEPDLAK
jgi:hypothetical protein